MAIIRHLLVITIVVLLLDAIWLTATATSSRQLFAAIQGKPLQIRWIPAIATYAVMIIAIWFFAVQPSADVAEAAGRGALLGLTMYGLYDLTNYSTLKEYTLQFTLTDMAWGTTLFTIAAVAATLTK
jgi:uncharacterized membrane protein